MRKSAKGPADTHIRVRQVTKDRLIDEAYRKALAAQAGQATAVEFVPELVVGSSCGVTMDELITWLLDRLERDRERQARAKKAAAARRKGGGDVAS